MKIRLAVEDGRIGVAEFLLPSQRDAYCDIFNIESHFKPRLFGGQVSGIATLAQR